MKQEKKNTDYKAKSSKNADVEELGLINIKPDIQKLNYIRTGLKKNIKKNYNIYIV